MLLYELLTGSTPLRRETLREAAFDEMLRRIKEEEPPKPSTRLSTTEELPTIAANRHTEPARLARLVRGELDWIVMKCLEKDRTRRYETANGLAADLRRYLNDEPVEAGPPSAWYRLRKFGRRNRMALATAAVALISAVAGLSAIAVVQTRARNALAAANARLQEANMALAASLNRETNARNALADANAELTLSKAAVQARYELAVDAIRTFHTGVSEDFLLKQDQFKELRDRLLKSATDFYGKLGGPAGQGDRPGLAAGAGGRRTSSWPS